MKVLNHYAIHLRLIQYGESTILPFKKEKEVSSATQFQLKCHENGDSKVGLSSG